MDWNKTLLTLARQASKFYSQYYNYIEQLRTKCAPDNAKLILLDAKKLS